MANDGLPDWRQYLATLGEAEQALALLADPNDLTAQQEAYRLLFLSLASGFLSTFADPDAPDFVPLVNNHFNSVGANPDFVYAYTHISFLLEKSCRDVDYQRFCIHSFGTPPYTNRSV